MLGATTSTGGAAPGDVEHPDPPSANTSPATAAVTKPRLDIIAAKITVTNRKADRPSGSSASAVSLFAMHGRLRTTNASDRSARLVSQRVDDTCPGNVQPIPLASRGTAAHGGGGMRDAGLSPAGNDSPAPESGSVK